MWVEASTLGGTGVCTGQGLTPSPHAGWGSGIVPEPLPERFNIRWFNFTQQRFYEAAIYDPEMPKLAKEVIKKYSVDGNRFNEFYFVAILANSGEVKIWFAGRGENTRRRGLPKFGEIIGSGQGYEIFGDPERYENRTEEAREKGEAPQEPLPPPPATQPPREKMPARVFHFDMDKKMKNYRPVH